MANLDINGLPYMLVGDITVGTATTSVSFTGLTISKDDDYMLVSDFNFAQDNAVNITVNGNTTLTNYYSQLIQANSSTIVGERGNYPRITASVAVSTENEVITKIKLTNSGYFIYQANNIRMVGSSTPYIQSIYGTSTFTSTSITQLTLTHGVANGIGIGSRFQLYKCVAEKVADITVATATTSVDITGLNIDKTGEYMLVFDQVRGATGTGTVNFFCDQNGTINTTTTNYYIEELTASSTSVTAARQNSSFNSFATASNKTVGYTTIKLTNSGYFVYQTNCCYDYGGANIKMDTFYGTSTFTTNSITQLRLFQGSEISVGSRIQLYKMK